MTKNESWISDGGDYNAGIVNGDERIEYFTWISFVHVAIL